MWPFKKRKISKKDLKIINDYTTSDTHDGMVPVNIWVCCYEEALLNNGLKMGIEDAEVTDLKTGEVFTTDRYGYVKTRMKPGRKLILKGHKTGYGNLQTSTIVVSENGQVGLDNEITLQIPGAIIWFAIMTAFGAPCTTCAHLLTTIQKPGKNMHDDSGLSKATASLVSVNDPHAKPIPALVYLGQIGGMTEWFFPVACYNIAKITRKVLKYFKKVDLGIIEIAGKAYAKALQKYAESNKPKYTSHDGAAIWIDVPGGEYRIEAQCEGYTFESPSPVITVLVDSDIINASPPHSPRAGAESPE
jgi:hypothetical protein